MAARREKPGFYLALTFLELLVVIAIVVVLLALGAAGAHNARAESARAHCLANLRGIASASLAYSMEDSRGFLLPIHPTADHNRVYDDGFFDFGGGSGTKAMWDGTRVGPDSQREAHTRPLNRWVGITGAQDSDYAVFRCSADNGFNPPLLYEGWDMWEDRFRDESAFGLVGTSYWGNACKVAFGPDGETGPMVSISPWLRPATRVPDTSRTVLYMEMPVGFNLSYLRFEGGVRMAFQGVAGWHAGDPPRFNLAFCDASAATVGLRGGWLPGAGEGEHVLRPGTVRFDCYPDPPIPDPPVQRVPRH